jgi:hypothetical protein
MLESLLRNALLLNLEDNKLVIGFANVQLLDNQKRKIIEQTANSFFNKKIDVVIEELKEKGKGSLIDQQREKRRKKEEQMIQIAREDKDVLEVLNLFPGSKIVNIKIDKEKLDD